MNIKKTCKAIAILLFAISFVYTDANAQDGNYYTVRDFEVWTGAAVKYKFNKLWSINFDYEYRLKDDASVMDKNYYELGLKRNIGDHFSLAIAGRYVRNNDTNGDIQGIENHFRWNADLGYKTDIKRFSVSSRIRFQTGKELGAINPSVNAFRLKLGTEYNIKNWKLDPEFSTEIYKVLSYQKGLDKIRFTLGTSYNMKKFGKLTGFFRIEKDFMEAYQPTTNILGIRYQYTFKKKQNEK